MEATSWRPSPRRRASMLHSLGSIRRTTKHPRRERSESKVQRIAFAKERESTSMPDAVLKFHIDRYNTRKRRKSGFVTEKSHFKEHVEHTTPSTFVCCGTDGRRFPPIGMRSEPPGMQRWSNWGSSSAPSRIHNLYSRHRRTR